MLRKVISGGQTGADFAGLWVAKSFGIETGGWAPEGFKTKDGPNPELMLYNVHELIGGGYKERTWANVRVSDGTIRLAVNFKSPGERCTLNAIKALEKPHFDVDLNKPVDPKKAAEWIIQNKIQVLNVAGNVQTQDVDIFSKVKIYLQEVFKLLGHQAV